jgi:hypothetical protein
MSIKVTVKTQNSIVASVKPKKTVASFVNIGPKPDLTLGQILNVDATDPDDREALIYDATTNKYIIKPIVVDSNNIINVAGGTF